MIYWIVYSRRIKNDDIRAYGSGNAGSTNVLRVYGIFPALSVFSWDLLKGFACVMIASKLTEGNTIGIALSSLAVVAGHNWPVMMDYRGGKGVATTLGVGLALDYRVTLICLAIGLLLAIITRIVSLGSLTGIILAPVGGFVAGIAPYKIIILAILAISCIYQHKGNIQRLIKGEESKITLGRK